MKLNLLSKAAATGLLFAFDETLATPSFPGAKDDDDDEKNHAYIRRVNHIRCVYIQDLRFYLKVSVVSKILLHKELEIYSTWYITIILIYVKFGFSIKV